MFDIDKLRNILELSSDSNMQYIDKVINEYNSQTKTEYTFEFIVDGQPENYVRERMGNGHWYNKKASKSNKIKKYIKGLLHKKYSEEYPEFCKHLDNETLEISVHLKVFQQTQKNSSMKAAVLKELGYITPAITPDIDNFVKFYLDCFHDVFYADDKVVNVLNVEKLYSIDPRIEVKVIATIRN